MRYPETVDNSRGSTKENVMKSLTQKFSKLVLDATIQVVAVALLLVLFGASVVFAQTRAYVTNAGDNTVSVIDSGTNTVVATVPVGVLPTGVGVNS
jgi:YVTN family beta-propeller protein